MPKLPFEFKKIVLGIILLLNLIFLVWLLLSNLMLITKIFLFLVFLCTFLALLVIFEAVNSFVENLFFWLVIAIVVGFLYWPAGVIILFLSLLKLIDKKHIYQTRLKFPFLELVVKDYGFFLLAITIIINLFIYQNLIQAPQLPLTFATYSNWLENFNKVIKINFPLDEKISIFLGKYFEDRLKKDELLSLFAFVNLPDKTVKELIYESLKNGWENENLKQWYIFGILLVIDSFFYPILFFLGKFIAIISLLFVYFLSFLKLFKIENKSVNKEIITL
jgi:hypothetical protein